MPQCMKSPLKPAWPWGFWVRNREAPTFPVKSSPVSIMVLSSYPPTQNWTVSLWSPVTQKNLCLWSTRSPIFLLSHPRALEALSVSDAKQLPVLSHHKLFLLTQSAQSSLPDVIGSFGFSLRLHVSTVSAWSMGHCPISILGAKLIEGQFSALLNNSQWHFTAPLGLVISWPLSMH